MTHQATEIPGLALFQPRLQQPDFADELRETAWNGRNLRLIAQHLKARAIARLDHGREFSVLRESVQVRIPEQHGEQEARGHWLAVADTIVGAAHGTDDQCVDMVGEVYVWKQRFGQVQITDQRPRLLGAALQKQFAQLVEQARWGNFVEHVRGFRDGGPGRAVELEIELG